MESGGCTTTTITRPPSKRARTRTKANRAQVAKKFLLSGICKLPVEILAEIFKNAYPADLISLSRTSRSFRGILMKRSAEHIWRCAEDNVPDLPSYPWLDINRPQYAALLFTKNCTECGKYTATNADPFLLVRLCQDCRAFVAMVRAFSQARSGEEFDQWKQDVRKEVSLRRQFGTQVAWYIDTISEKHSQELEVIKEERMAEIEAKLRELGWTDRELDFQKSPVCGKWLVLVRRIRPMTEETWNILLPKLTLLLEANRARIRKLDSVEQKETYQANIHRYVNDFRLAYHPLWTFIEALGFEHLLEDDTTSDEPASTLVSKFLDHYPFPDTPTILGWPFIKKLGSEDMGRTETFARLANEENRIDARLTKFIKEIEDAFAFRLIPESPADAVKFRTKRSVAPPGTDELPWNTQILLRADALFANADIHNDDPERPQRFYYYTDCLKPRGDHNARTNLSGIAAHYCRYEKAEEVATALLECIGTPNASFLELAILGKKFCCERCSSLELMDWKGILKHYLDELHIWSALSAFKSHPKFRPQSPIYMTNAHKLDELLDNNGDCIPLVSLLNDRQVHFQLVLIDMVKDSDSWYCAPCRNYGRRYVSQAPGSSHMWNCHRIHEEDATQGVHYFFVEDPASFLERGGAWADSWDTHHKGREEDPEVDDEDIWN